MKIPTTEKKINLGILNWLGEYAIKNEKGDRIEFDSHPFLFDIYDDQSQYLVVMKAAQVGMSTLQILKNHYDAKRYKMDIIYTLPTDKDVSTFVGGKVNRIIANNPPLLADVADKDSIEQKAVGRSMIYFRGTWTKKSAIMVTADRLVHDEKDSSKLDVIADYQTRLQHSKFKQIHTFSHPSLPQTGVDVDWLNSDQKHWFIKCPNCPDAMYPKGGWQYLSWDTENPKNMSIDIERKEYVCKLCRQVLSKGVRKKGRWVPKYINKPISGYWVPLLICPWVSAADIVAKFQNPEITTEHFYTKVLGLPYADGSSKLLATDFLQNLTGAKWAPAEDERVVMGVDTGLRLDYVLGNLKGLFHHGDANDYGMLDGYMERWKKMIAIVDAGGDMVGSRKFKERWPGRVFLCQFGGEMKGEEIIKWGKKEEHGSVRIDRNRMIQLVIGEFRERRIPVHGTEEDWYEYYQDWSHLSKIKVLDSETNHVKGFKWVRSARDHRAMATVLWRTGMRRFAGTGAIIPNSDGQAKPNSYMMNPDKTVSFSPQEMFDKAVEQSLDALEDGEV